MTQPAGTPTPARQTPEQVAAEQAALSPNMQTDPEKPEAHYFLASDGKTKINAFGEEKGSTEDKKRW